MPDCWICFIPIGLHLLASIDAGIYLQLTFKFENNSLDGTVILTTHNAEVAYTCKVKCVHLIQSHHVVVPIVHQQQQTVCTHIILIFAKECAIDNISADGVCHGTLNLTGFATDKLHHLITADFCQLFDSPLVLDVIPFANIFHNFFFNNILLHIQQLCMQLIP